jgi:hypothetical protein
MRPVVSLTAQKSQPLAGPFLAATAALGHSLTVLPTTELTEGCQPFHPWGAPPRSLCLACFGTSPTT